MRKTTFYSLSVYMYCDCWTFWGAVKPRAGSTITCTKCRKNVELLSTKAGKLHLQFKCMFAPVIAGPFIEQLNHKEAQQSPVAYTKTVEW